MQKSKSPAVEMIFFSKLDRMGENTELFHSRREVSQNFLPLLWLLDQFDALLPYLFPTFQANKPQNSQRKKKLFFFFLSVSLSWRAAILC